MSTELIRYDEPLDERFKRVGRMVLNRSHMDKLLFGLHLRKSRDLQTHTYRCSDADEFFHDLWIISSQFKATVAAVAEAENDHAVPCDALYDLKNIAGALVESVGCVTYVGLSMAAGCDTDDLVLVFKLCNEGLKLVDVSEDPSVKQQKGFAFAVNFIV